VQDFRLTRSPQARADVPSPAASGLNESPLVTGGTGIPFATFLSCVARWSGAKGGTAMQQYVVYRHGWNDANQSRAKGLPEKMPVARVDAGSPEEACRIAARSVTIEANQHLSAEPAAAVDAQENKLNLKGEALHSENA
jgi:hypothetical protein